MLTNAPSVLRQLMFLFGWLTFPIEIQHRRTPGTGIADCFLPTTIPYYSLSLGAFVAEWRHNRRMDELTNPTNVWRWAKYSFLRSDCKYRGIPTLSAAVVLEFVRVHFFYSLFVAAVYC